MPRELLLHTHPLDPPPFLTRSQGVLCASSATLERALITCSEEDRPVALGKFSGMGVTMTITMSLLPSSSTPCPKTPILFLPISSTSPLIPHSLPSSSSQSHAGRAAVGWDDMRCACVDDAHCMSCCWYLLLCFLCPASTSLVSNLQSGVWSNRLQLGSVTSVKGFVYCSPTLPAFHKVLTKHL